MHTRIGDPCNSRAKANPAAPAPMTQTSVVMVRVVGIAEPETNTIGPVDFNYLAEPWPRIGGPHGDDLLRQRPTQILEGELELRIDQTPGHDHCRCK